MLSASMKKKLYLFSVLLFATVLNLPVLAQTVIQKTPAADRLKWYDQQVELTQKSVFKNLPWQFVGPTNISGRMTDVEVVTPKGKNYTIYVAGASGGIWKTENEGITWKPIFEHAMSTAFGDLALDPQNQNVIWAGTGEANIFRSSNAGAGIYRSKDGGETWEHLGTDKYKYYCDELLFILKTRMWFLLLPVEMNGLTTKNVEFIKPLTAEKHGAKFYM